MVLALKHSLSLLSSAWFPLCNAPPYRHKCAFPECIYIATPLLFWNFLPLNQEVEGPYRDESFCSLWVPDTGRVDWAVSRFRPFSCFQQICWRWRRLFIYILYFLLTMKSGKPSESCDLAFKRGLIFVGAAFIWLVHGKEHPFSILLPWLDPSSVSKLGELPL